MIEPKVVETHEETVAFITMRGPYSQTPEGYGRLYAWIERRGLQPAGMPAATYLTMPGETSEADATWELWAPIADPAMESAPDDSGVGIKRIASATAVSAMHKGPYDGVGPTYDAVFRWIHEHGYLPDGPPMERYYSDPAQVPPEEYLTEVVIPVRPA